MSRWIGATAVAVLALAVAGVIGTAGAQDTTPTTPTTTAASSQRLITVNGAGEESVASDANAAARNTAYRTALTAALDDAKSKAGLIAGREGLTLGAVQSVTEQGNSLMNGCAVAYGVAGKGVAVPAPARAPAVRRPAHRKLRHRRTAALRATPMPLPPQPYPCDAQASVTVSYAVS
jgi:uncharacterized protein YggE